MKYALIGKKLGHSFSAKFFNEKFDREGIPSHYSLVELSDFNLLLPYLKQHPDIVGLNVTIPYKEDAFRLCDYLTPEAEAIGAVNTIKVIRSENDEISLFGTNTDAPGFALAVGDAVIGRPKALVLGTGGASKAVKYALNKVGVAVKLVSRTDNAKRHDVITYQNLTEDIIKQNLIIVNTTPLGMYPDVNKAPEIPYQYITPEHYCFDAIYNPEETMFMRRCAENSAQTSNGLQMLHNQALLAWEFWNR